MERGIPYAEISNAARQTPPGRPPTITRPGSDQQGGQAAGISPAAAGPPPRVKLVLLGDSVGVVTPLENCIDHNPTDSPSFFCRGLESRVWYSVMSEGNLMRAVKSP